jgi:multidrug resistance protein
MKKSPQLYIVYFTVFLDLLGFGILIPLLPYVAESYNVSKIEIGCLMASYSLAQFIFSPIWGRLSDRIGRRPIILLSLLGSSSGYLLFALADSMTMLFVARIIAGCASGNISAAQAIVADTLPPEERTKGMGMIGASIGLGFMLGPALAGFLVSEHSYALPFIVAASLSGLDLILAFFFLPETVNNRDDQNIERRRFSLFILKNSLGVKFIPHLFSISLIYHIALASMESSFALFGHAAFGMNERENSYIMFLVGVIMVAIQGGVIRSASKRYGDRNLLLFGIMGVTIGFALIGYATSFKILIAATIFMAIASGFIGPSISSLISQFSAKDVQGGILGLNQSMASMGRIIGPIVGTILFQMMNPRAPFYAGSILLMFSFLIIIPLRRGLRDNQK